jgi:Protein of unknown function (Hypoth_ymh).
MIYNVTSKQKAVTRDIVNAVNNNQLEETFFVIWGTGLEGPRLRLGETMRMNKDGPIIVNTDGSWFRTSVDPGILDALGAEGLLRLTEDESYPFPLGVSQMGPPHRSVLCTVIQKLFDAVATNFAAPDTSFVRHLTPLADVSALDSELKARCLPILGAGAADPKLWDSAVRTAGVILEERLRSVGSITDRQVIGRDLVNKVLGKHGALAGKFAHDAEREAHRDLYAGVVGAFRNPSAHRLVDPSPHEGGAFIVFVNLLLKMLEDLRHLAVTKEQLEQIRALRDRS